MRDAHVFVLSDYAGNSGANSGGAGLAVLASYRALRDSGIDADLLTGFGESHDVESGRFTNLHGTDLRAGAKADVLRAIYNPSSRTALRGTLAGSNPATTLIILHQWTRYLSPSALGLLAGFRVMIYMHDYFWACPNGAYFDYKQGRACTRQPMGFRCIGADCDKQGRVTKLGRLARQTALTAVSAGSAGNRLFLSLSESASRTARGLLPGEEHAVVYNPLSVAADAPVAERKTAFDVGYFGRLEVEKGVADLMSAGEALGVSTLLVGEGALEQSARKLAGVTLRRWQAPSTVAETMRSCRVVVLPSRWPETWGLIIPEAMAAGVPVLVSRRAGSAELVRRFGGGDTFDPDMPGDLQAKLAALLSREPRALDGSSWRGFRKFLAPETHARRISALAAARWGLELSRDRLALNLPQSAATVPQSEYLPLSS